MTGAGMSDHEIQVLVEYGELSFNLVCNAPVGAPCRLRPPIDELRESWLDTDPDLVDGPCWAVEWIDAAGIDALKPEAGLGVWASIPVKINYDEGVSVTPTDQAQPEPAPERGTP